MLRAFVTPAATQDDSRQRVVARRLAGFERALEEHDFGDPEGAGGWRRAGRHDVGERARRRQLVARLLAPPALETHSPQGPPDAKRAFDDLFK